MIEILNKSGMKDHVMFASFNYDLIEFIKSIDNELHFAAIKIPSDDKLPSELAKSFDIEAYICAIDEMTPKIDRDCIDNNIFTGVYSVDTIEDFQNMNNFHITAYGTNYPALIKELIDNS